MQCPRCQRENPEGQKFCGECGVPLVGDAPARPYADLKDENEALGRSLTEAQDQQTATSEILRAISSSLTDVQPVFAVIARNAVRLCGGVFSIVLRFDGELIHFVAHHNLSPGALAAYLQWFPRRAADDRLVGRAILERRIMNVPDVTAEFRFVPGQREDGFHSVLFVPMLRDGVSIGAIGVSRTEIGAFPENQVELLKTFADEAVIAIENVRLFTETKEALDQQTATSEILRVISSSPTDVQPVFTAVAASAARLCDAFDAAIHLIDGDVLRLVAHEGPIPPDAVLPLTLGTLAGHVVRDRRAMQVADMHGAEGDLYPVSSAFARHRGFRTILGVPLLRGGEVIGTITIRRTEVRPFTERQAELLRTFADQAVIAIENVRLFKELEERNRELTEALAHQTGTAEILKVISSSPTDLQIALSALTEAASRLCGADHASVYRVEDGWVSAAASYGPVQALGQPLGRGSVVGRAVVDGRTIHVHDLAAEPEVEYPEGKATQRRLGHRTVLATPLLREGRPIGALAVWSMEVRPFSDKQIALLQTFADQAVIAIENVRLFTALEARNRDLTAALEQQTATGEILRVISSSPTDEKPVFDAIARSSVRLCGAAFSVVAILDADEMLHLVASEHVGTEGRRSLAAAYPMRPNRGQLAGRAILDRAVVHVADVTVDPEYVGAALGNRATLSVPMLRKGTPIGTITIGRFEPMPFTDQQIELLKTFADQAVIAIENVRLFTELQSSNRNLTTALDQRTATSEVLRTIAQTKTDLQPVFDTIVQSAARLCHAANAAVFLTDGRMVYEPANFGGSPEALAATRARFPRPVGMDSTPGIAILTRSVFHVPDIEDPSVIEHLRQSGRLVGFRSVVTVPMLREGEAVGALLVARPEPGRFSDPEVQLLKTFADQGVIAIENVRLLRDLEAANRQLQAASQHKSEFLANMSHELRTPLNAIIGFSEVLSERMFGELNEKQEEYLKDIYASGQHLLSLINDILDLSKIEAGRMELELTDFDLPQAIDNAVTLVRERAGRRRITLQHSVDEHLGEIRGDERKVKQVLLNLLSNALKFTPEGGRVDVRARMVDGMAEISVTDTGVGIAPADQEAVFAEFRQVGTAEKKAEGTGLGLTLCRKFVELHGGRIWVKSEVGVGSTFSFTLPVRGGQ